MADRHWTVKDLAEALKQVSIRRKRLLRDGAKRPRNRWEVRYVKAWRESDEMGVLLDR